ncbi:MAG TPA: class I SAM-dependent methyltransferase [Rummeliibacillus sp.]|nr:class I SAM-dependent methyltransferase [Rummeliibacillus sp.]
MLNKQGFNLWANDYDQTVQLSEENNHYPFAGYKTILNTIFNEIMQKEQSKVLDIGFGTAVLTTKLYENGHQIDGLDFSAQMINIAQAKMPTARLMEWDISKGLPKSLKEHKYDFIVSTYTLHHLTDEEKITFIKKLLFLLEEDGEIVIGDIAFKTREQLETCREESLNYWDEEEYYFVEEELHPLLREFCQCEFHPISHCGGVFIITRQ